MKLKTLSFLTLTLYFQVLTPCFADETATRGSGYQIVTNDLISFKKSGNYAFLVNACNSLNTVPHNQLTLELKLKVLQTCHSARDLAYDLNGKRNFTLNVAPPLGSATVTVAGMDPREIKDPVARKTYEDALAENHKNEEKYRREITLQRMEDTLINEVRIMVKGQPSGSPVRDDIMTLVNSSITDKGLREKLLE